MKRLLMSAIGLVVIVITQGCSMFGDIVKEHEQICVKNMKVIVHDEKLWQEYKILSEIAYQQKEIEYRAWINSDAGPKEVEGGLGVPASAGRASLLEHVEGFDQRYGPSIKNIRPAYSTRPYTNGQILRDDLFLMKGDKVVIQVVDYIVAYQTLGAQMGFDCQGHYGILYTDKGLTPGKKTKTGYSTDAATLEKLHDEWPEFIGPLLRYREIEKLRSTYGEGLLNEIAADGRIHATFNQTVARTGRLSSDKPNLHNIPVRSDEGRVFRTAFVAPPGWSLLVADYNQIELRCIAHLANDPGLVSAFQAGEDIHTSTAARVFGVKPEDVSLDQRSKAKMVSYGLAYGMEAYGLSQRLAIPVSEAAGILDAYFEAFPNVKQYMDDAIHLARQTGYTETLFGRRRHIEELMSDNFRVRQAGERQAMNAAIQGLAADIFKIALVRIDQALVKAKVQSRVVLQVHDEVIVEVPDDEKELVGPLVLDIMKAAAELIVPLEVNAAWGPTWAEAKG
jgi:DNA polymerase I